MSLHVSRASRARRQSNGAEPGLRGHAHDFVIDPMSEAAQQEICGRVRLGVDPGAGVI